MRVLLLKRNVEFIFLLSTKKEIVLLYRLLEIDQVSLARRAEIEAHTHVYQGFFSTHTTHTHTRISGEISSYFFSITVLCTSNRKKNYNTKTIINEIRGRNWLEDDDGFVACGFCFSKFCARFQFFQIKNNFTFRTGSHVYRFYFFFFCIICLSNFRSTAMREEINRKP